MRPTRRAIWPALALTALLVGLGCRNRGDLEPLERQLRKHEDEIYHLEDHLSAYKDRIEELRLENAYLRRQLRERGTSSRAAPIDRGGPRPDEPALSTPEVDAPPLDLDTGALGGAPPGEQAPPFRGPPLVQPPSDEVPEGYFPPESSAPPFAPPAGPPSEGEPTLPMTDSDSAPAPMFPGPPDGETVAADEENARHADPATPPNLLADASQIAEITLNPGLTGRTRSADGVEIVQAIIEPRDANGQVLEVTGDVAIVVLDPSRDRASARVARWDFAAAESAARFDSTGAAPGMHFRVRWPADPPNVAGLRLYVRLTTPDGRQFIADQPLTPVAAPVNPSGWQEDADTGPRLLSAELPIAADTRWHKSREALAPPRLLDESAVQEARPIGAK